MSLRELLEAAGWPPRFWTVCLGIALGVLIFLVGMINPALGNATLILAVTIAGVSISCR